MDGMNEPTVHVRVVDCKTCAGVGSIPDGPEDRSDCTDCNGYGQVAYLEVED